MDFHEVMQVLMMGKQFGDLSFTGGKHEQKRLRRLKLERSRRRRRKWYIMT
jgi:hypothetical protein